MTDQLPHIVAIKPSYLEGDEIYVQGIITRRKRKAALVDPLKPTDDVVQIPFSISSSGVYSQWGHDRELLGENVDLLEALRDALRGALLIGAEYR